MGLSYLSQDDIMQWAPWFWVIMAYKWTADQGKTVPPLPLAWRTQDCDVDRHACALIQIWIPQATVIELRESDDGLHVVWRDARVTAWLQGIRDPRTPRDTRRAMAKAYDHWWRRVQARILAKTKEAPWLAITLRTDTFSWAFDTSNYADYWDDPVLMDLVHWFQSLAPILADVPEVTPS